MISVVPQIQFFKLDPHWEFVVVGSDGVWDAMSNQEMSNYIKVNFYAFYSYTFNLSYFLGFIDI